MADNSFYSDSGIMSHKALVLTEKDTVVNRGAFGVFDQCNWVRIYSLASILRKKRRSKHVMLMHAAPFSRTTAEEFLKQKLTEGSHINPKYWHLVVFEPEHNMFDMQAKVKTLETLLEYSDSGTYRTFGVYNNAVSRRSFVQAIYETAPDFVEDRVTMISEAYL